MAATNTTLNSLSNRLMRPEARHPVFGTASISSLQLAPRPQRPFRIAVIGHHLPRQCGIATFTTDLCNAIAAEYGAAQLSVVAVNDGHSTYSYPERVRFEISEGDLASYREAAEFLNAGNVDLVCLQHEYGIFGGKSGNYIIVDLPLFLRQPVKTQNPTNGELSHGIVTQDVHQGVQAGRRTASGSRGFDGRGGARAGSQPERVASLAA